MTTSFSGHFDGKVLVPNQPVDLPTNCDLSIQVAPRPSKDPELTVDWLLRQIDSLPLDETWPADGAEQHDHYLYGTPKR